MIEELLWDYQETDGWCGILCQFLTWINCTYHHPRVSLLVPLKLRDYSCFYFIEKTLAEKSVNVYIFWSTCY